MTRPKTPREPLAWVMVANAARARCFERDPENQAMRELASFVHPQSRMKGDALGDEPGGKVHKGVASTQFQPRTDVHAKEHEHFARQVAQHLEQAALAHQLHALVLIASNPFLGELRGQLGDATQRTLKAAIAHDFTSYEGAELEQRVSQALAGLA